jgi:hypothetical protein
MDEIIEKANKGGYYDGRLEKKLFGWGYMQTQAEADGSSINQMQMRAFVVVDVSHMVLDPLFWRALGGVCKWTCPAGIPHDAKYCGNMAWSYYAIQFHEKNLTESWEKALEYLKDLVK